MTDREKLDEISDKVTRIEQQLTDWDRRCVMHHEKTDGLHEVLHGNGRSGALTELRLLRQKVDILCAVGAALALAVGGQIAELLFRLLR